MEYVEGVQGEGGVTGDTSVDMRRAPSPGPPLKLMKQTIPK